MTIVVIQVGSAGYENSKISCSVLPVGKLWLGNTLGWKQCSAVLLGI